MAQNDPNAWMLTFSDLITLLLTFFVLLLTMNDVNENRFQQVFNLMSPTLVLAEGAGGSLVRPMDGRLRLPTLVTSRQGKSTLNTRTRILDAVRDLESLPDIDVRILASTDSLTIQFPAGRLFRPGSSELDLKAFDSVTSMATVLRDIPYPMFPIRIEGYPDPPDPSVAMGWDRGTTEGQVLASARAYEFYKAMFNKELSDMYRDLRKDQFGIFGHGGPPERLDGAGETDHRSIDIVVDMTRYNQTYPGQKELDLK